MRSRQDPATSFDLILSFALILLRNVRIDYLSEWSQSYAKEKEIFFYLECQNV